MGLGAEGGQPCWMRISVIAQLVNASASSSYRAVLFKYRGLFQGQGALLSGNAFPARGPCIVRVFTGTVHPSAALPPAVLVQPADEGGLGNTRGKLGTSDTAGPQMRQGGHENVHRPPCCRERTNVS